MTTQVHEQDINPGADGQWLRTASGAVVWDTIGASDIPFSPAGTIAATDVQAAIEEVAAEATGATFGTPAIVLGTVAANGSTDEAIRRDSTIVAFDATVPSTQAFGDSAAAGTAVVAARRDHKHAMPATPTSVSGNAGTATALQTSRNIDGQAFNGTADITVIAPGTHAAASKTPPVDADELPLADSAASFVLKKLTWANLKATIKAYTDTLYPSGSGTCSGTNTGDQTVPSFATNAVLLGSAAAAGAAATVMRSNDTIAAFDTTAPTTQAFGDAAAVGTAAFAARRDHKHAMMADPFAGTTAALAIGGVIWTTIVKSADTGRNTTVTVAVDPHLAFTAASGTMYEFEFYVVYVSTVGAGTPDFKEGVGEDTTVCGTATHIGLNSSDTAATATGATSTSANATWGTATALRAVKIWGHHRGLGGSFGLFWAQGTSNGNDTTVKAGSILRYRAIL